MNKSEAFSKDTDFKVMFNDEKGWIVVGEESEFVYGSFKNKMLAEKEQARLVKTKKKTSK